MTTITKKTDTLASLFLEAFYSHKPESPWAELVTEGAGILQKTGLPTNRNEEYKFTLVGKKIESHIGGEVSHAAKSASVNAETLSKSLIPGLDAHILVINNGILDKDLSSVGDSRISVRAFTEGALPDQLGRIAKAEKDPFVALNQLGFQDGVSVEIPDHAVIDKPVVLLHFVESNQSGASIHPRVFVKTGKNAEITLIENIIPLNESPYLINGVTEIQLGENSHVHFYKIQDESKQGIEVNNTEVNVPKNATFTSAVLSLQGLMIRNNLTVNLLDSNTEGNMYGLYLLNGGSHVDNHTNVDHTKPHAESNELYKGILADKSRGVFNGKIFVRQDAQKTNAFQQNNNILLSEDAVVNTKPQLEIWADDVKCSHGCTTGQLDEEALFYLRTRGISKDAGKALLLYAFAGEVLEKIKNEDFKAYCIKLVQERLGSQYAS